MDMEAGCSDEDMSGASNPLKLGQRIAEDAAHALEQRLLCGSQLVNVQSQPTRMKQRRTNLRRTSSAMPLSAQPAPPPHPQSEHTITVYALPVTWQHVEPWLAGRTKSRLEASCSVWLVCIAAECSVCCIKGMQFIEWMRHSHHMLAIGRCRRPAEELAMYRTLLPSPTEGGFAPRPYGARPLPAGWLSFGATCTHNPGCCLCSEVLQYAARHPHWMR